MTQLQVLIVDDDAADRKLIRRLLAGTGIDMTVHQIGSGREAREIEIPRVDAVFLDQNLPDVDGISLLRMFRSNWPRAAVMLMTGQGSEDLAKSAIIMGAVDYVSKGSLSANAIGRMLQTGVTTARLRARLEEQQRELATFSETLVHDLRAPIRSVDFLANLVSEDLEAGDKEAMRQSLRMMQTSVTQMKELLDGLASYIRHDRDVQMTEAAVADMLARALAALDLEIKESGARIDHDALAGRIVCRPEQVAQLFQNLIANAIKYSGGATPHIRIEMEDLAEAMRFRISDNGVGIPHRYRKRVFEPFRRGVDHKAPHGTGLGLSTCRKIVRRHDGDIRCEDSDLGGASIVFRLSKAPRIDEVIEFDRAPRAGAA